MSTKFENVEVVPEEIEFDPHPMMERKSHSLGEVRLYAPKSAPSEWKSLPWQLTTRNGWEGRDSPGLVYILRPEVAVECYHHIALVESRHLWD